MERNKKKVLVLCSGGVDSTACINYYINTGFDVTGFFINYGQASKNNESLSVKKVSSFYGIKLESATFCAAKEFGKGKIQGRNGFLIMAALLSNPGFQGLISLGIHSGTPYYDCSPSFVQSLNSIIEEYTEGKIKLDVPFLTWDKKMIYDFCKDENIPIHLTYSCERGGHKPCGRCLSCLDRSALGW
ncbi:MAG: 7-cyano-7-deazaguanine synthase [Methanosarcinaceae archaeon]